MPNNLFVKVFYTLWLLLWVAVAVIVLTGRVRAQPVGVINTAVAQDDIATTICKPGWTAIVRPSAAYTNRLKREQLKPGQLPKDFEEDHFIPIELGGHPTDPNNLWPQPWDEARKKDQIEDDLHRKVCAGQLTLEAAQAQIRDYKTSITK